MGDEKPMSLKERIAALNQAQASAPAPAPARPASKPGNWAWKQKQADAAAAATSQSTTPSKSVEATSSSETPFPESDIPRSIDASADRKAGMSASDAVEAVKGQSLKERMAALQGKGAFGSSGEAPPRPLTSEKPKVWKRPVAPATLNSEDNEAPVPFNPPMSIPGLGPPPFISTPAEGDEESINTALSGGDEQITAEDGVEEEDDDEEEKERQRRAALAARMAKLGGARVGMGPPIFGRSTVKSPPAREAENPVETIPIRKSSVGSHEAGAESPGQDTSTIAAQIALPGLTPSNSLPLADQGERAPAPVASPPLAVPKRALPPRKKSVPKKADSAETETPEILLAAAPVLPEEPAAVTTDNTSVIDIPEKGYATDSQASELHALGQTIPAPDVDTDSNIADNVNTNLSGTLAVETQGRLAPSGEEDEAPSPATALGQTALSSMTSGDSLDGDEEEHPILVVDDETGDNVIPAPPPPARRPLPAPPATAPAVGDVPETSNTTLPTGYIPPALRAQLDEEEDEEDDNWDDEPVAAAPPPLRAVPPPPPPAFTNNTDEEEDMDAITGSLAAASVSEDSAQPSGPPPVNRPTRPPVPTSNISTSASGTSIASSVSPPPTPLVRRASQDVGAENSRPAHRPTLPPPSPIDNTESKHSVVQREDNEESDTSFKAHQELTENMGDEEAIEETALHHEAHRSPYLISTIQGDTLGLGANDFEHDEVQRRRTLAERMSKLGGIKFGAPGRPTPPEHNDAPRTEVEPTISHEDYSAGDEGTVDNPPNIAASTIAPEDSQDGNYEETEEESRSRRAKIAARLAGQGGLRFGMLPGAGGQASPPFPQPDTNYRPDPNTVDEPDTTEEVSPVRSVPSPRTSLSIDRRRSLGTPPPVPRGRPRPPVPSERPPPPPPSRKPSRPPPSLSPTDGHFLGDEDLQVEDPEEYTHPPPPAKRSSTTSARRSLPPPPLPQSAYTSRFPDPSRTGHPEIPTSISNVEDSLDEGYSPVARPPVPRSRPTSSVPAPQSMSSQSNYATLQSYNTPEALQNLHRSVGANVLNSASSLVELSKKNVIGDGSARGFIRAVLAQVPNASQPAFDNEAVNAFPYGPLIYSQNGTSVQKRASDIMPGDIIELQDAKFKRAKLGGHSTAFEQGVGIVNGFEEKKSKVRVWQAVMQANTYPTVDSVSYRLDDLKSGTIKIFRVAEA